MDVEAGRSSNGLPYLRFGTGRRPIIGLAALTFDHSPTGAMGRAAMIDRFRFLARDYTVYVVNRRRRLQEGASMADIAADYAAMIRADFDAPVDIIGVSTGGSVALQLALDHPEVLRRVVIYSAAHRLGDSARPLMLRISALARDRRWGAAAAEMFAFLYLSRRGPGRLVTWPLRWLVAGVGTLAFRRIDPSDLLATIKAEDAFDIGARLGEIRVPTLLVGGERDPAYPADLVHATAAAIPGAQLLLFPDKGHAPTGEAVTKPILAFLLREA
jgi:pimeloyl-ACP methyl ester carboxylesterase